MLDPWADASVKERAVHAMVHAVVEDLHVSVHELCSSTHLNLLVFPVSVQKAIQARAQRLLQHAYNTSEAFKYRTDNRCMMLQRLLEHLKHLEDLPPKTFLALDKKEKWEALWHKHPMRARYQSMSQKNHPWLETAWTTAEALEHHEPSEEEAEHLLLAWVSGANQRIEQLAQEHARTWWQRAWWWLVQTFWVADAQAKQALKVQPQLDLLESIKRPHATRAQRWVLVQEACVLLDEWRRHLMQWPKAAYNRELQWALTSYYSGMYAFYAVYDNLDRQEQERLRQEERRKNARQSRWRLCRASEVKNLKEPLAVQEESVGKPAMQGFGNPHWKKGSC